MSPVPIFENHVFISYGHFDNEHAPEVGTGRIDGCTKDWKAPKATAYARRLSLQQR